MYHFPFTKLPPLTGSTSQPRVVCVCGWGWTHQRGGKGKPETCNFKLGCAHKMHGTAISHTGMYDCSLYSNSGDWHPVYHTGRAKSCLMFSVSPVIVAPLISSLIGPCMMDSGTSGLSKLMLQSKPSSFVHKLCFKKRKIGCARSCETDQYINVIICFYPPSASSLKHRLRWLLCCLGGVTLRS